MDTYVSGRYFRCNEKIFSLLRSNFFRASSEYFPCSVERAPGSNLLRRHAESIVKIGFEGTEVYQNILDKTLVESPARTPYCGFFEQSVIAKTSTRALAGRCAREFGLITGS